MEIRQLKYYLQVCKDLNLSRAAGNLFITQQALSQSMKNMEDELDAVLFTRNSHGIILTEIGDTIRQDVEKFVEEYDNLLLKIQYNTKSLKSTLKFALPPGIITTVIPSLLNGFSTKYPDINLKIIELDDIDCESALKSGKVDIACSVMPVDKESFDCIPLFSYCSYLYVNKANPLSHKASVTFSDLREENFLLISENYKWHDTIIQKCNKAGFEPNVVLTSSQTDLLAKLVSEKNMGVTFFIEPVAKQMLNENTAIVPIRSTEDFRYETCLILNSNQKVQKYSMGVLIDHLTRMRI